MFCRKKEINARVRNFKTHHRNQERPGWIAIGTVEKILFDTQNIT
jgi:ribosomal protein L39E